jgi:two-component system chemotaxis sensor kinase CheA
MAFSDELLPDFFAECDEHLIASRQAILELGDQGRSETLVNDSIDTLFRSFHSIKGLSAMVGLQQSESVAHVLEGYLSRIRKQRARVSENGLTTIIQGVKLLEEILQVKQSSGAAYPDVTAFDDRIGQLELYGETENASAAGRARSIASLVEPRRRWLCSFAPTPTLAARGINVNVIRGRLESLGTIVSAAPEVAADGRLIFRFTVETVGDIGPELDWKLDGLTAVPIESISPEEPHEPTSGAQTFSERRPTSQVVRVDLSRLDDLMRMVGDLVITRARLEEQLDRLRPSNGETKLRAISETNDAFERQIRDLREGVTRMRLVPLHEVFGRMQFVVQDLTRDANKRVALEANGADTEVDKLVVDRILDPLLHLVRNAISHGLESIEERISAGKPPEGNLRITAKLHGESVQIDVEDDGRGVCEADVQRKAIALGILPAAGIVDKTNLLDILCSPGFSTRDEADRTSGRGMGMSAVATAIEQLAGTLELHTASGRGSRFTIRLPLSLSIADALVIELGQRRFVVPQGAVDEVIEIDPSRIVTIERQEMLSNRGDVLPMLRLANLFRLTGSNSVSLKGLVIGEGANAVVVVVDRVLGVREIVVRPLLDPLLRVAGINGATELGDGHIVLIVDPHDAVRMARMQAGRTPHKMRTG